MQKLKVWEVMLKSLGRRLNVARRFRVWISELHGDDDTLFSYTWRNIVSHIVVLASILLLRLFLNDVNLVTTGLAYALITGIFLCLKLNGEIPILYAVIILALEVILAFYSFNSQQNLLLVYWLFVVGVTTITLHYLHHKR
jgi:hypothetical protein